MWETRETGKIQQIFLLTNKIHHCTYRDVIPLWVFGDISGLGVHYYWFIVITALSFYKTTHAKVVIIWYLIETTTKFIVITGTVVSPPSQPHKLQIIHSGIKRG